MFIRIYVKVCHSSQLRPRLRLKITDNRLELRQSIKRYISLCFLPGHSKNVFVFPVWSSTEFLSDSISNTTPGNQTLTVHFDVCLPPARRQQRKTVSLSFFPPSMLCLNQLATARRSRQTSRRQRTLPN